MPCPSVDIIGICSIILGIMFFSITEEEQKITKADREKASTI